MENKNYWDSPFGKIEKSTESIMEGLKFSFGVAMAALIAYIWTAVIAVLAI